MKRLITILAASLFILVTAHGQVPTPQITLTGNIGAGFVGPLFNSGNLVYASDADRTMAYPETSAFIIKVTSTVSLTATRNLIAPVGYFPFVIENLTTGGQSIQFIGTSGTGITIPNGSAAFIAGDGTNYFSLTGSGGGGSGVASINGTTGAFTFTGSGVSCTSTTCTFSSGSGMVYPSGSGVAVVSGGTSWGTTLPVAGSGAGVTTGPNSGVTPGDIALFTGTGGQITDGVIAGSNLALLSGTQTFTGNKTFSGTVTLPASSVTNSNLVNSSVTVSGTTCTLGGTCAPPVTCGGSATTCALQQINPTAGPAATTTTSSISTSTTAIPVASCSGFTFAPGAIIAFNNNSATEYVVASGCSGTTLTATTRGFWNAGSTTAGSQIATAWASGTNVVQVTSGSSTSSTVAPYAFQLANGAQGFVNTSNVTASSVAFGGMVTFNAGITAGGASVVLDGGSGAFYTAQASTLNSNIISGCGTSGILHHLGSSDYSWFTGGVDAACTSGTNLVPPNTFVFVTGGVGSVPTTGSVPQAWITQGGEINAKTGFQVGAAAPSGHCLVGNGTDYVDGSCSGSAGTGSPIIISIATTCASAGAQADLNTGLTPSGGTAGDYGSCINTQAALAATSSVPVELWIDGSFKVSGVALPNAGNVQMVGSGGGMNRVFITAYSCSGTVCTFTTQPQSLLTNNTVMLGSFGTSTFFNAQAVKVIATGLSSTQFEANFTHAAASATENGEADYLWGTGLVAATATNNDVIHNGAYTSNCFTDPGTVTPGPAPGRGANIIITDMVINGWGATLTGANGNSNFGNRQGNNGTAYSGPYTSHQCTYTDISIRDMENVKLDNLYLFNAPAHELDLGNVGHVAVTNSYAASQYPDQVLVSTDGFHVNGQSNDLYFSNLGCRVGECFAFNAPEGWSGGITGVTINGIQDDGSNSFMRLYASSIAPPTGTATAFIDGFSATNLISNSAELIPIEIGVETTRSSLTVSQAVRNINIADSLFRAPYAVNIADNYGDLQFSHITWQQTSCLTAAGFISTTVNATTGGNVTLKDITVERTTTAGNCTNGAISTTTGGYSGAGVATVGQALTVNGFAYADPPSSSIGAVSNLITIGTGSSFTKINKFDIDWTNITAAATGAGLSGTQIAPYLNDWPSNQVLIRYTGGSGAPVTDQNNYDCLNSQNQMICRTINDANSSANAWMTLTRSGFVPTSIVYGTALTANSLNTQSSRKGTFTCTAAGTITISNTNEATTSDVIISLRTAGGTITTSPAMKTVTGGTGFTVLCGATDTSVYNYNILN